MLFIGLPKSVERCICGASSGASVARPVAGRRVCPPVALLVSHPGAIMTQKELGEGMIETLPDGPLDIVGDVHGELDALLALLAVAGYDEQGRHPDGRHLVFLGDLVDRGPDSPGVVRLVRRLIDGGRASCILGNHELNLLRGERKAGNDWFWNENTAHDRRYHPWNWADPAAGPEMLAFFERLPLALVRSDLRIVHAAWHEPSMVALSALPTGGDFGELFTRLDDDADRLLESRGVVAQAKHEKATWRHHFADPEVDMPMLHAVGQLDEDRQMLNPVRVLTSGVERRAAQPFFASGQWRFAERVRWWDGYTDDVPVVVGHYWRQFLPLDRKALGKGDPDLFDGVSPRAWLGPRGRVFCVDFSVGGRWQERKSPDTAPRSRLGLLRWPEKTLVLDTGEMGGTVGFAAQ